jgi:hypothetical protein
MKKRPRRSTHRKVWGSLELILKVALLFLGLLKLVLDLIRSIHWA